MAQRWRRGAMAALLIFGCGTEPGGGLGPSDGGPVLDGGADDAGDGAVIDNDGGAQNDGSTFFDASTNDASTASDGGSTGDGGPLGPICTELSDCCPMLQFGQQQCLDAVASGDEMSCQRVLNVAQQAGSCGGLDAGPPVDGGPLGPVCSEYLACCPLLPAWAQGICARIANGANEMRCQQALDFSQECSALQDGGVLDAGTSTTADAGTSTVADAG